MCQDALALLNLKVSTVTKRRPADHKMYQVERWDWQIRTDFESGSGIP